MKRYLKKYFVTVNLESNLSNNIHKNRKIERMERNDQSHQNKSFSKRMKVSYFSIYYLLYFVIIVTYKQNERKGIK